MINYTLPAMRKHGGGAISVEKLCMWYLGVAKANKHVLKELRDHNHTALISDPELRANIRSYLDVSQIPDKYKEGKKYYRNYSKIEEKIYRDSLHDESVLKKEEGVSDLLRKFYDPTVSPLLAGDSRLVGLPSAFIVCVENDPIKDESLLYAERLKRAGVNVELMFYDNDAYHGICSQIDKKHGYQTARDMQNDLIRYLSENL
jgi:acetyl esterase/lipase